MLWFRKSDERTTEMFYIDMGANQKSLWKSHFYYQAKEPIGWKSQLHWTRNESSLARIQWRHERLGDITFRISWTCIDIDSYHSFYHFLKRTEHFFKVMGYGHDLKLLFFVFKITANSSAAQKSEKKNGWITTPQQAKAEEEEFANHLSPHTTHHTPHHHQQPPKFPRPLLPLSHLFSFFIFQQHLRIFSTCVVRGGAVDPSAVGRLLFVEKKPGFENLKIWLILFVFQQKVERISFLLFELLKSLSTRLYANNARKNYYHSAPCCHCQRFSCRIDQGKLWLVDCRKVGICQIPCALVRTL